MTFSQLSDIVYDGLYAAFKRDGAHASHHQRFLIPKVGTVAVTATFTQSAQGPLRHRRSFTLNGRPCSGNEILHLLVKANQCSF